MINKLLFAACAVLLVGAVANAQTTAGGTLALSGTLQPSIVLLFHQNTDAGIHFTSGDGSSIVAASLSTVTMYSTPNGLVGTTNFTKSQQADGFTLTGVFNVEVDIANSSSASYTLTAARAVSDDSIWTLTGAASPLSTTAQTVITTGAYTTQAPLTLAIKFPAAMPAGAVGDTISFSATAN